MKRNRPMSITQKAYLDRLRQGHVLSYSTGINPMVWWRDAPFRQNRAAWNVVYALEARGLVKRKEKDWRGGTIILTENTASEHKP